MKKLIVVVVILGFVGVAFKSGWDLWRKTRRDQILKAHPAEGSASPPDGPTRLTDLMGSALSFHEAGAVTSKGSEACRDFWRATVEIPWSTQVVSIQHEGWGRPNCVAEEPTNVGLWGERARETCSGRRSQSCFAAVLNYRSELVEWLFSGKRNFQDMALALLLTKVHALSLTEQSHPAAVNEVYALCDNLVQRDRTNFAARKLVAMAYYFTWRIEEDENLKADLRRRLSEALVQAEKLQKGDSDLRVIQESAVKLDARPLAPEEKEGSAGAEVNSDLEFTENSEMASLPETAPEVAAPQPAAQQEELPSFDVSGW